MSYASYSPNWVSVYLNSLKFMRFFHFGNNVSIYRYASSFRHGESWGWIIYSRQEGTRAFERSIFAHGLDSYARVMFFEDVKRLTPEAYNGES